MQQDDPTAPATKEDIRLLMDEKGGLMSKLEELSSTMEDWKEEIIEHMHGEIHASEGRMKRYVDVKLEDLRYDIVGVHKDDIETVKDHVTRLERHTGLIN